MNIVVQNPAGSTSVAFCISRNSFWDELGPNTLLSALLVCCGARRDAVNSNKYTHIASAVGLLRIYLGFWGFDRVINPRVRSKTPGADAEEARFCEALGFS